jgi:hypothetical protein
VYTYVYTYTYMYTYKYVYSIHVYMHAHCDVDIAAAGATTIGTCRMQNAWQAALSAFESEFKICVERATKGRGQQRIADSEACATMNEILKAMPLEGFKSKFDVEALDKCVGPYLYALTSDMITSVAEPNALASVRLALKGER